MNGFEGSILYDKLQEDKVMENFETKNKSDIGIIFTLSFINNEIFIIHVKW